MCSASVLTPCPFATEAFSDATAAVARLQEIYDRNTRFLRDRFEAYINGERLTTRVRATYPLVWVTTSTHARLDSRLSCRPCRQVVAWTTNYRSFDKTIRPGHLLRAFLHSFH